MRIMTTLTEVPVSEEPIHLAGADYTESPGIAPPNSEVGIMWLAKRILTGLLIAGWAAVAFGGDAAAIGQSDWERRVLRDSHVKPAAAIAKARSPVAKAPSSSMVIEPDAAFDKIQLDPIPSEDATTEMPEGVVADESGAIGDGGSCGTDCGPCAVGCEPCIICGLVNCVHCCGWLRSFEFSTGVEGFKGPLDQGQNGNFGFNEAINFGAPLGGPWGVGYQIGARGVQSNFKGYDVDGVNVGQRDQIFATAGLFRRAVCGGLQWGAVFDFMHDRYYQTTDLNQIRAEVSWLRPGGPGEIGFWGSFSSKTDEIQMNEQLVTVEPTDLFALFYRRHFCTGGEGRMWGGFTGNRDGLFGGDVRIPFGTSFALETGFNYLIPNEPRGAEGLSQEGWNVGINLVWYPGRCSSSIDQNPFHPLLGVANNGNFMVNTRD